MSLINEHYTIFSQIETFWYQRSCIKWLHQGDSNTGFFLLRQLKRSDIYPTTSHQPTFFFFLFGRERLSFLKQRSNRKDNKKNTNSTAGKQPLHQHQPTLSLPNFLCSVVSDQDNESFLAIPTMVKTRAACFSVNSSKAPGTDGFNVKFFKIFWEDIKHDIHRFIIEFCRDGILPRK